MLTDDEFWDLISTLGGRPELQDDRPYQNLTEILANGDPDRIVHFADSLAKHLFELDRRYLAESCPGLTDDGFLYARCAVVVAGRGTYLEVLSDPTKFKAFATLEAEHAESVLDVASNAFKIKTGREWDHVEEYDYETGSNQAWW